MPVYQARLWPVPSQHPHPGTGPNSRVVMDAPLGALPLHCKVELIWVALLCLASQCLCEASSRGVATFSIKMCAVILNLNDAEHDILVP
jgi:hypothetical protein